VHEQVHGAPLETGLSTTVTDGGWTAYFGIPTILYGPGSLEEAHSVDEKISVSELENFSEVLYKFLKNWYNQPQK
jgi:acetylornithine deacetylase/succinyl-diaminopimelate desuccinylase-like protein